MTDKKTPAKTPAENRAADKGTSDESPIARRHFLLGAGTAVAAGLAPTAPVEAQTPQASPGAAPPGGGPPGPPLDWTEGCVDGVAVVDADAAPESSPPQAAKNAAAPAPTASPSMRRRVRIVLTSYARPSSW